MKPLASYEAAAAPPSYHRGEERWLAFSPNKTLWREVEPVHRVPVIRFIQRAAESALASLLREIERSREMLTWGDDWDEEGSPHFEEATWRRAVNLLDRHARLLLDRGVILPTPRILPGPNASIDLHWETNQRELLINVPPEDAPSNYYGETAGKNSIKGKIDPDKADLFLFSWLTTTD
jgi:hypothetical protein